MRTIKFRVYNKESKEIQNLRMLEDFTCHYVASNIETLMQFTGLTDKHGKEIYEGDILTNGNPKKEYEDIFEIKWDEVGAGFMAVCKRGELTDGTLRHWNHSFKIIGNIYENPELLHP